MSTLSKEQFEHTSGLFIDAIHRYFGHIAKVDASRSAPSETGVPFAKSPKDVQLKDYTGMIGISGNRRGFVYFSGTVSLFEELLQIYTHTSTLTQEKVLDMAGEVSNVIAGNVRETFGEEFMISVPVVFKGKPEAIKLPDDVPVLVIPIKWKSYEACMVIGLEAVA